MWAPRTGFIAYIHRDVKLPAQVCYGAVKYQRQELILIPDNEIGDDLEFAIKKQFRVITNGKRKFLIPPGKLREFNKEKRKRYGEWAALYLLQKPVPEPQWENYWNDNK